MGEGKITYKAILLSKSSLEKASVIYRMSIYKYLVTRLCDKLEPIDVYKDYIPFKWVDLGGQVMPEIKMQEAMKASSIDEMESIFNRAHEDYDVDELNWIGFHFKGWRNVNNHFEYRANQFDNLVEADRLKSITDIARDKDMLGL